MTTPTKEQLDELCTGCGKPIEHLSDAYSTDFAITAGGETRAYIVPGSVHRRCCQVAALAYRDRLIQAARERDELVEFLHRLGEVTSDTSECPMCGAQPTEIHEADCELPALLERFGKR